MNQFSINGDSLKINDIAGASGSVNFITPPFNVNSNLTAPTDDGVIPISVNGVKANSSGNIIIPIGESGTASSSYISAIIGSIKATSLGLVSGLTVYTNANFIGKQVMVERDLQNLPDEPWNGNTYYTKPNLADDFITFSDVLQNGDHIKITIL